MEQDMTLSAGVMPPTPAPVAGPDTKEDCGCQHGFDANGGEISLTCTAHATGPDAQTPIWRCVSCGFEDTKPLREGVNNHWRKGYRPGKSPRSEDAICYAELKPVTDQIDAQTPNETPRTDALYSSIDGKLPSIQFGEMFAHARQLERENTDLRRQLAEALRPTQNIIATYDPPNPSALLHDQVFAVLQRLEAAADAAVGRAADSAEALRRMTIAADGWSKTAKASAQKLATIDAALRSETRERKE